MTATGSFPPAAASVFLYPLSEIGFVADVSANGVDQPAATQP
jgi:hypothetical protein